MFDNTKFENLSPSILYTVAEEKLSKKLAIELNAPDPKDGDSIIWGNVLPNSGSLL